MDRVPLYLVNGAGYGASLLEAKLIAQAELFRLFQDDWESALIDPALNRLADTADAEQLASELCSWPSSIGSVTTAWALFTGVPQAQRSELAWSAVRRPFSQGSLSRAGNPSTL